MSTPTNETYTTAYGTTAHVQTRVFSGCDPTSRRLQHTDCAGTTGAFINGQRVVTDRCSCPCHIA